MIVRALDVTGDWIFGTGKSSYLSKNNAVAQEIQCRLKSFVGDCFFDLNNYMDWFNLLGTKNQVGLNLAITSVILNTPGVTGIKQLLLKLDHQTRVFSVQYQVQTIYSQLSGNFQYDITG